MKKAILGIVALSAFDLMAMEIDGTRDLAQDRAIAMPATIHENINIQTTKQQQIEGARTAQIALSKLISSGITTSTNVCLKNSLNSNRFSIPSCCDVAGHLKYTAETICQMPPPPGRAKTIIVTVGQLIIVKEEEIALEKVAEKPSAYQWISIFHKSKI